MRAATRNIGNTIEQTTMNHKNSDPKKRRFQFSLKSLLIVMLVVAAYFAGKVSEQRRAHQIRNEVERALMAEQEARMMAEATRQQAEHAAQQARESQARLADEMAKSRSVERD